MNDMRNYQIEVQDQVDENDLNATSPIKISRVSGDKITSTLTVRTDQSGLIGLLRHLHARGLVLLSFNSAQTGTDIHYYSPPA